jgi:hypothetical protein
MIILKLSRKPKLQDHTFELTWSPEGRVITLVQAKTIKAARRKAPQPFRKYLGEISVREVL